MTHRFIQHVNQLAVPTVVLGELLAGAYRPPDPTRPLALIDERVQEVRVLDFGSRCAERFGQLRGRLLQQGVAVSTADLMTAAVALVHDLTLVTHSTKDFENPGICGSLLGWKPESRKAGIGV